MEKKLILKGQPFWEKFYGDAVQESLPKKNSVEATYGSGGCGDRYYFGFKFYGLTFDDYKTVPKYLNGDDRDCSVRGFARENIDYIKNNVVYAHAYRGGGEYNPVLCFAQYSDKEEYDAVMNGEIKVKSTYPMP